MQGNIADNVFCIPGMPARKKTNEGTHRKQTHIQVIYNGDIDN
jgi:hypothetical protein